MTFTERCGKKMRLRRSILATPATNDWMFNKAASCGADIVFLDLEDSVPSAAKCDARVKAIQGLQQCNWGSTERAVRINSLDTPWAHDDIIEILTGVQGGLDSIVVPKVTCGRDIWWVDVLLNQLEAKLSIEKSIRLHAVIENVDGLLRVEQIAGASNRLDSIIFGSGDYSVSVGMRLGPDLRPSGREFSGDLWQYPRNKIVIAARRFDVAAIDAGYLNYGDLGGFEYEATQAAVLGFDGKLTLHPAQVAVANRVFCPTEEEISMATKCLEIYADANRDGKGASQVDGIFIDAVHARAAERTLVQAKLACE